MTDVALKQREPLTAADRCDRCGAPAVMAVQIDGAETVLCFCGHHSRVHSDAIRVQASVVYDVRGIAIVRRVDNV